MNDISKAPRAAAKQNEGEGGTEAARSYNKQAEHAAKSGKVEAAAREAVKVMDGPEGMELRRAEAEGMINDTQSNLRRAGDAIEAAGDAALKSFPTKTEAMSQAGASLIEWSSAVANQIAGFATTEMAIVSKAVTEMANCRTPSDLLAAQRSFASAWFTRAMSNSAALGFLTMHSEKQAMAHATQAVKDSARDLSR
jgi:hypothetical protein